MEEQQETQERELGLAGAGNEELEQVRGLWDEYGRPVVVGVVLGLIVVFGVVGYKSHHESVQHRSSQLLSQAQSIEDLRSVVSQYPETASAPMALLAVAAQYFDAEQYEMAQSSYRQFEESYPEHPMVKVALIGKAYCLEASGQLDQALNAFSNFAQFSSEHFMSPVAHLGRARCLMQLGRHEEARIVFEDFIAANPESRWLQRMESELTYLDKESRAKLNAKPEMAAPPPSISPFLAP